jgi:hypothetical protein
MTLARRDLAAVFATAAAIGVAAGVPAQAGVPDVVAYCEPALRHAVTEAGRDFGHPVHVFCSPPPQMLAQLERTVQNDVLITQPAPMDEATRRGLIVAPTRAAIGGTVLVLVLAGRAGRTGTVSADPAAIAAFLGPQGRLAVSDPTPAATIDGAAILDSLGWSSALAGRVTGAANERDVAFLVATGAARLGLLTLAELRADPRLALAARLPGAAPVAYEAAVSKLAKSPNAAAFVAHLRAAATVARLRAAGLEVAA